MCESMLSLPFLSLRVSVAAAVSESRGSFLHFPELDIRIHKPAYTDVRVCVSTCVMSGEMRAACFHGPVVLLKSWLYS